MTLFLQNKATALMIASCNGHTEVVKMLLADRRVNVNVQDEVRDYIGFSV